MTDFCLIVFCFVFFPMGFVSHYSMEHSTFELQSGREHLKENIFFSTVFPTSLFFHVVNITIEWPAKVALSPVHLWELWAVLVFSPHLYCAEIGPCISENVRHLYTGNQLYSWLKDINTFLRLSKREKKQGQSRHLPWADNVETWWFFIRLLYFWQQILRPAYQYCCINIDNLQRQLSHNSEITFPSYFNGFKVSVNQMTELLMTVVCLKIYCIYIQLTEVRIVNQLLKRLAGFVFWFFLQKNTDWSLFIHLLICRSTEVQIQTRKEPL